LCLWKLKKYIMPAAITNFDEKNYTDGFIKGLYTKEYHNNHWSIFRPRNLNAARIIHETLQFDSIVDFGCSIGTYLEYYLSQGCEIKGYEYCYDECKTIIENVDGLIDCIEFGDVTTEIKTTKKYDVSSSSEVAEHIPTSKSDIFVNNLCNAANKYIFLTAAGEGQGGTGHINCQKQSFWVDKFKDRGWERYLEMEKIMKDKMKPVYSNDNNNEYPIVWSFIHDNMMIFKK